MTFHYFLKEILVLNKEQEEKEENDFKEIDDNSILLDNYWVNTIFFAIIFISFIFFLYVRK